MTTNPVYVLRLPQTPALRILDEDGHLRVMDGQSYEIPPGMVESNVSFRVISRARAHAVNAVRHLKAQGVHGDPIRIDTSWLLVGHVDEIISFAGGNTLLMPCPYLASTLIHERLEADHDNDPMPIGWGHWTNSVTHQTIKQIAIAPAGANQWKDTRLPDPGPGIPAGQAGVTNVVEVTIPGHPYVEGDYVRVGPEIMLVEDVISTNVVKFERGHLNTPPLRTRRVRGCMPIRS